MEFAKNEAFKIKIDNYSGPLEALLDLAKSQKVNLEKISISQLADQFIEFINSAKKINLDLASEYLLMATWLAYLKSKLLLPEDEEGAEPLIASDCKVIVVPLLNFNVNWVPTEMFAKSVTVIVQVVLVIE